MPMTEEELEKLWARIEKTSAEIEEMVRKNPSLADDRDLYEDED